MQTVVKMKFGSHLYGTSTPSSDTDYKGVHIPDAKDIILGRVQEEINAPAREKAVGERNVSTDVDDKSYTLKKFFKLVAEGQTVAIDMLFAPQSAFVSSSRTWELIQANRHRLLTRKSASFLGYCRDQANKYGIKGSRVAAAQDASRTFEYFKTANPRGKISEIPNTFINGLITRNPDFIRLLDHPIGSSGKTGRFIEVCGRKMAFTSPIAIAAEVFTKLYNEYGDRAQKAKTNEGVDWKALSHAVRVGYEAVELLRTNHIVLPLRKADYVRAIKLGEVPYQRVANEIEELLGKVEDAAVRSTLPEEVDHQFMEKLLLTTYYDEIIRTDTNGKDENYDVA